jgi:integrase
MGKQAAALLRPHLDLSSRHAAKLEQGVHGARSTGRIHSLRTLDKYVGALKLAGEWARREHGLRQLSALTVEQARAYLEHRAARGIGQKQLDADRVALEFVTGPDSLRRVAAQAAPPLAGRAYTPLQVERVGGAQSETNALATRIAYEAGLRGHELLTLRRADEARPSGHRTWHRDRFLGREGVRYVVTGKGGLRREVLLSRDTAALLEARRLATPREVVDRGVVYAQVYDLNGGNRWAVSFSAASRRELGWSAGAHGLRHAYAQERMRELRERGLTYHAARLLVSQELGHFRGEIVETYLR